MFSSPHLPLLLQEKKGGQVGSLIWKSGSVSSIAECSSAAAFVGCHLVWGGNIALLVRLHIQDCAVTLWQVISVLFHQPDVSWITVMPSGSFMKRMSQAAVNDLLTYWGRREDGVQCFFLCLFKDTSFPYVRAAQGSFIPKHWNLRDY